MTENILETTDRKLATIRRIDKIEPIEGADAIDVATVDGWKVVVKKGDFNEGDLAVYLEIDSWVPQSVAPFLCEKLKEPRVYKGVPGERLRTIRLRGQVSQGLLLPVTIIPEFDPETFQFVEGDDLTEGLGVQKWERELPACLGGSVRGNFPSFIPKTDQERIQNLKKTLTEWLERDPLWEVTEKLDGSSMTVYVKGEDFGVCSRNLDLKETDENAFWKVARKLHLFDRIRATGENIAIQGELIGPGVQKNRYGLNDLTMMIFDIYHIDRGVKVSPLERFDYMDDMHLEGLNELINAPHIGSYHLGSLIGDNDPIEFLLKFAEGKSLINPTVEREGIVFKSFENNWHFKAISNKYLLKNEE